MIKQNNQRWNLMLLIKNLLIEIVKFPFIIVLEVILGFIGIFIGTIRKIIIVITSGAIITGLCKILPLLF